MIITKKTGNDFEPSEEFQDTFLILGFALDECELILRNALRVFLSAYIANEEAIVKGIDEGK